MWYHKSHRRRTLPDRRHLVADRDRRDHDHAAARRHADQARLRHAAVLRRRCRKVVDDDGNEVPRNAGGKLVIRKPVALDAAHALGRRRALQAGRTGASSRPAVYFTGDGAAQDKDGYFWIVGRIDDVLNVSGHRIGTAEIESALVSHPDGRRGRRRRPARRTEGPGARRLRHPQDRRRSPPRRSKETLREHVAKEIGALARPDNVRFADALPKTRSGKIMRRLLKEIAAGGAVKGDTTTLEDFSVLASLQKED